MYSSLSLQFALVVVFRITAGSVGQPQQWSSVQVSPTIDCRDAFPVFSVGGHPEQFWHGQGCPLFDVVHYLHISSACGEEAGALGCTVQNTEHWFNLIFKKLFFYAIFIHSVATFPEMSSHTTRQGILDHSHLCSLSHYGLILAWRVEYVCVS